MVLMAALGAATLAACATEAPAPPPPPPILHNAAAPPPVSLASGVVRHASAFRSYMARTSSIRPGFTSGPAIENSLTMGEAFESNEFSRSVVAYAAVVALQEPGFVANVRAYAADPEQRRALAAKIMADPYYATALPGAQSAAGLIIVTLNTDAAKLRGAGELVKQSAYDVQHQAWSKTFITDPGGRLAAAKSLSAQPMSAEPSDLDTIKRAVTGSDSRLIENRVAVSAGGSGPPYTQVVVRGLAIAALAALGEGGDENDANMTALLADRTDDFCLHMSKLNLYQCLAVAKPWYEDIFCLGQHVMIDTGQCVAKAAGQPQPVQTPVPPTAQIEPPAQQKPAAAGDR